MLTLSHSQMELFHQCPRRWRLTKLDRVPQAPSEALLIGDALHQAVEADGRAWMARQEHIALADLQDIAAAALRTRLERDDPQELLTAAWSGMYDRTLEHVRAYVAAVQAAFKPTAVEEPFSLSVPDAEGLIFTGRIDAIQLNAEGTPVVIDLKTSAKGWPLGIEHEKDQATAYLWATAPVHAVRVTFVVLSPQGVSIRPTIRTERQIDAYVAKVRATATAIEAAKASGEFEAKTGPLCGWCSVIHACPDGRQWLVDHGRVPQVPVLETEAAR